MNYRALFLIYLAALLTSAISLASPGLTCADNFMRELDSPVLRSRFHIESKNIIVDAETRFVINWSPESIKEAIDHKGPESVFLYFVSNQISKQLGQNVYLSEFHFKLAYLEQYVLNWYEGKADPEQQSQHIKQELKDYEIFALLEVLKSQNQLVYSKKPKSEVREFENKWIKKLEELYFSILLDQLKQNSINESLWTKYVEQINLLKSQFYKELRLKTIDAKIISAKKHLVDLDREVFFPAIFSHPKSASGDWTELPIEWRNLENGNVVLNATKLAHDISNLASTNSKILIPMWVVKNIQTSGAKGVEISFGSIVSKKEFFEFMQPQMFMLKEITYHSSGLIDTLEFQSFTNIGAFSKFKLKFSSFIIFVEKIAQINKNWTKQSLNWEMQDIPNIELNAAPFTDTKSLEAPELHPKTDYKSPKASLHRQSKKQHGRINYAKQQVKALERKRIKSNEKRQQGIQEHLDELALRHEKKLAEHEARNLKAHNSIDHNFDIEKFNVNNEHEIRNIRSLLDKELHSHQIPEAIKNSYIRFTNHFKEKGLKFISSVPGYNLEALSGNPRAFSLRLNIHYRLYFAMAEKDNQKFLLSLHIGKHDYDYYFNHIQKQLKDLQRQGYKIY